MLGPEDLSFNDMAEVMSDVLGTEVRFQQTTFEAYTARFVELGMSEAMAQGMTDMAAAKSQGLDNAVKRTPGNSTPTSFRQWCEEVLKPAVLTPAATSHRWDLRVTGEGTMPTPPQQPWPSPAPSGGVVGFTRALPGGSLVRPSWPTEAMQSACEHPRARRRPGRLKPRGS